jgi:heme/copper-type cytochrome/quinol oxidase subunit 2
VVETTTSAAPETTTTAAAIPLIRVEDGAKVEGLDTLSVRIGESVIFDVASDQADEIHVHGFDLYFDVMPGQNTRVEFSADATGIFEVELHDSLVKLLDIEVTP